LALALTWGFLLFSSCSDDASLVGFRKDPRLDTRYVEIPLDFGVFLREPIVTQNIAEDNISRLLVGRISDPDIGDLEAKAYFNFSPPIDQFYPSAGATFVSLQLQLKFDYYSIGVMDSSDLHLEVYEVADPMTPDHIYYSGTTVSTQPTAAGDTIFAVGPQFLNEGWAKFVDNDATNNEYFVLPIKLDATTVGQSLLDDLKNDRLLFEDFLAFSTKYTGFAITMPIGNKILGFTPVYSLPSPTTVDSKLILKYLESDGTTLVQVDFPIYYSSVGGTLNPVVTYTFLNPDRTTGVLNGIVPFEDFKPADDKMYIQSGTGIMGKFDLGKFYEHFDPLQNVVINSAELVMENTYSGRTPQSFEFLLLDSGNQYRAYTIDTVISAGVAKMVDPYLAKINRGIIPLAVGTDETRVAIADDLTNGTLSIDQEDGTIGKTLFSEFFQQLVTYKSDPRRVKAFALHPMDNEFKKTVSQIKLSGSSAKLKIYYSVPLTNLP
jgi:hypothetical protein